MCEPRLAKALVVLPMNPKTTVKQFAAFHHADLADLAHEASTQNAGREKHTD